MEQYTQQPIIIEPEKPAKKPVGLQLAALIVGIVGMVLSYLAYFGTIFSNIAVVAATELRLGELAVEDVVYQLSLPVRNVAVELHLVAENVFEPLCLRRAVAHRYLRLQ